MNGWSNRATWLVAVWFSPETRADIEFAREAIEQAEDAVPNFLRDFLCTDEIKWDELLSRFDEDDEDD